MAWHRQGSVNASLSGGGCWDVTTCHFSGADRFFREKSNSQLNLIFLAGLLFSGELFSSVQCVGNLQQISVDSSGLL